MKLIKFETRGDPIVLIPTKHTKVSSNLWYSIEFLSWTQNIAISAFNNSHLEPGIARCIPFNNNTNNLAVHPPWMTGTTVTKSPSCKSCSSAFKTEESTPFMTIRKSLRITLASELEAALLTNETISFIDAGCFSYFKEEQPIIFLQFPRKFMVIKR
jgi:transposase-like protein